MKKLILSLIFTAVTFTSFAMQAEVVSTKGKAEVQNAGAWVALKAGDTLDQGSVIQTGFKSEVVLKIKESTVTVAPLSRLTLQTLAERQGIGSAKGRDDTTIFLDTGSLRSNVQKSADRRVGFTVRSPVATASVRGTIFDFATRYKSVALNASQGKVAFWKNTKKSEAQFAAEQAALDNIENIENVENLENQEAPENLANQESLEAAAEGVQEAAAPAPAQQDSFGFTPDNAIFVTKGEAASVSQSSGMSSPAQIKHNTATSIGEGTKTAAETEKPVQPGLPPAPVTETKSSNKGSLVITVGYEE